MKEFSRWYEVALCTTLIQLIYSPIAYTADAGNLEGISIITESLSPPSNNDNIGSDAEDKAIADANTDIAVIAADIKGKSDKDVYTINFNNISIIELIRFTSKLTNLNFVFQDADLQFSVTLVSEEAITARSMMAALSQVLRTHDLVLLEQGSNVLITKSTTVQQVPPIVSADTTDPHAANAALITRVFRIKNANVNAIANIIRPMISLGALIEVSTETRQLIVTDIATNVEQIAILLHSLDAPHSPLDVETFVVKHVAPTDLITLTERILSPFTEGNPLIFVPQPETNSIYIVSTPFLIERAMTVMEDLDIPEKKVVIGKTGLGNREIFIYTPLHRSPQELIPELNQVSRQLKTQGGASSPVNVAIENLKEIKDTNSLMFIADPETLDKLRAILTALDMNIPTEYAPNSSEVFIYKPQYVSPDQIQDALRSLVPSLKSAHTRSDQNLAAAIDAMQWNAETQSFMVTSAASTIARLKTLLSSIDTPQQAASPISKGFFLYKLQYKGCQAILDELNNIAEKMPRSSLQNQQVITSIHKIECIKSNNSLLITGTNDSIDRIRALISEFDVPGPAAVPVSKGFYLYKLQHAKCETVLEELNEIADKVLSSGLKNAQVVATIKKVECIKSSNSLLITGPDEAIDQVKAIIAEFDVANKALLPTGAESFLIYKPKYLPAIEVQTALTDLSNELQASGLDDPQLLQTLNTMRYVKQTDSLLFTGSQENLDKVQNLISGIDTSGAIGAIQNIGNITFLLYKIQSASPEKLISSLKTFAIDLKQSNVEDKELADAINGVKWIRETNSLLFTGNNASLEKVEQLVKKFDIPSLGGPAPVERAASTFVIYNPKYLSGNELISILYEFMDNLMASGVSDPGLFDTIRNLKWIDTTSSLLISGDPQSVEKVDQLLIKFDIPNEESATPSIELIDNTSFLIYKLQYHPGNDIQNSLRQVAASLGKSSNAPATLVDAINSLQWIEITNSLLCTGQQEVLVKLKDLIQSLDIPLRQVFIEVLVIQTALNNQQNFGLMWGGQVKYLNKTVLQSGNFPLTQSAGSQNPTPTTQFPVNLQGINGTTTPNNTSIPFSTGFDLGVIGDIIMHKGKSFISLGSLLNAIQLDTDSTVILNPKIITQDNRQSTVFVGQNIPYTGALVTNQQNNTTITANIEYRDVGVSLTITPILGDDNIITMDIVQDISQVTNSSNVTTSATQLNGIQTNHTHMETRVHVPDNHFVALSGLIDDSKTHYRTAIPCLGGLPVIGALFSENDRNATKNNVIIFVRPQIITSYQEYKKITEHQEWLYKDNSRLPVLKEEFDEGIDLVKVPENE